MDVKKDREFSFVVSMNDIDLENFGYDPKLITDEEFQEIVENVEIIFQEEDHWAKIFVQSCEEILPEGKKLNKNNKSDD